MDGDENHWPLWLVLLIMAALLLFLYFTKLGVH